MARSISRIRALKESLRPTEPAEASFWGDINRRIKDGKVIPVLSNAVRNDRIFSFDSGGEGSAPGEEGDHAEEGNLTIDEQLAEVWAESIDYPMRDKYELPRIAQFNLVKSDDAEQAKTKYLTFLKLALLSLAEEDEQVADLVGELKGQIAELGFADIAQELDYPRLKPGEEDPLRLLARLPLPVYVTTSYYDFMERALLAEGRKPCTQVCFWSGELANISPEYRPDPAFIPSATNPLVYHLHGLEMYPRSLVLGEDDYLDFLVAVAQDTDTRKPVIPLYLREALAESSLILLGYRLQDWDFRVIFRGIVNPRQTILRLFSLIIQLKPEEQSGVLNSQEARNYLQRYFEPSKFKVEWGNADAFIRRLWEEWNKWRQAQA